MIFDSTPLSSLIDSCGFPCQYYIFSFAMSWSLFWICWCVLPKEGWTEERHFEFVLDEISVTSLDPDLVEKFDCQLFQLNNRSYFDVQLIFNRNLKDLRVHNTLEFWKPNNKKVKLYDVQFEGCSFLGAGTKSRLLNIYAKSIKKHSNLRCPLKAHFNYTINQMFLDEQEFPSFVPLGPFRTIIEFSTRQGITARLTVNGKSIAKT